MTSKQFTRALTLLGITQVGLARALKINDRTVRDWVGERSPVPTTVAALLNLMLEHKTPLEKLKL